MDNSVDRKNAIRLYLTGTIGQITVIAVIVYLLRRMGIEYYGAAEPPVRCGESHLSGLTEPLRSL